MKYTQLSKDYKYDLIASNIHGREVEMFHYDFDRQNFEYLLSTTPEGSFKEDIKKRLAETLVQMEKVDAIHGALIAQIDNQEVYDQAVVRVTAKRTEEEKNKNTVPQ